MKDKTSNFTYVAAPTFTLLPRNTEHQESLSIVQKLKPPLIVLQSSLYDILRL
jgi:hypothetical protein